MDYKEKYESWLNNNFFDEETRKELESIKDDPSEIEDRFYQELEFGTAGLRGILGAGTNRMNKYNVGLAAQGLALTILAEGEKAAERGVAIGYDVRHGSKEFAQLTAQIMAGNGIKAYLHEDITPTPVVSYSIRKLGTISGVMVTASHNPREYNGYKVYWEEGSQILDDVADKISGYYKKLDFEEIKIMDFEEAKEKGLIEIVGEKIIAQYISDVLDLKIHDESELDKSVKILYTPLNGTGNKFVRRILAERGFENVSIVKEQENPDPDFTTAPYPNPDNKSAFKLAENLGHEINAELLMATDPDADRLALEVLENGEYVFLGGNEIGSLMTNYILEGLTEKNQLPENGVVVKSIVTTDLVKEICKKYGVELIDVLTGFKNIYATQNEYDKTGEKQYIFGFEESIGYSYGSNVRDKDAVSSSMMIAEMAAYYKKEGKSLLDVLREIYNEYGYYQGDLASLVLEGSEGKKLISLIMEEFRNDPIKELGSLKLDSITDYEKDDTGLPKSNVLKYLYDDKSWYALRPSGTEPKIKMYIYSVGNSVKDAKEKIELIKKTVSDKTDKIIESNK